MSPESLSAAAKAVETAAAHARAGRPDDGEAALDRARPVLEALAAELPEHARVRRIADSAATAAHEALRTARYAREPATIEKRHEHAPWAAEARREIASERNAVAQRAAKAAQRAAQRLVAAVTGTTT